MAHSSFGGRRAAIVGLSLLALPVPGMTDALTEVRCALAQSEGRTFETMEAARMLAEGHAALFAAPKGWTCERIAHAEGEAAAAALNAEFLCQNRLTKAHVTIGGSDGLADMQRRVDEATPKTFRRSQHLFARGPWELAMKDGVLVGVLDAVATVSVRAPGEVSLDESDLLEFIATFNRFNQKLPDLTGAEERYKQAVAQTQQTDPEIDVHLQRAFDAMPSILSMDDLGFTPVESPKKDKSDRQIGAMGFTKTLPWAIAVLSIFEDDDQPTPEIAKALQSCPFGKLAAGATGSCLTHNGYTYWFGPVENEGTELKASSVVVPLGKNMVLAFITFGPAQGVMTDAEVETSLDKDPKIESPEDMEDAFGALFAAISYKNDPNNLPTTVNTILDEFDAQGLARLDIARYPVDLRECAAAGP